MQKVAVLSLPTNAGFCREGFFQHGSTVGKDTVAHAVIGLANFVGELLQAFTHHFVVVTAECVARDVGKLVVIEQGLGIYLFFDQVVKSYANHRQGIGHQLRRAQSLADVTRHIPHFTVIVTLYPLAVMLVMRIELNIGNTDLLKSQFVPDLFNEL